MVVLLTGRAGTLGMWVILFRGMTLVLLMDGVLPRPIGKITAQLMLDPVSNCLVLIWLVKKPWSVMWQVSWVH